MNQKNETKAQRAARRAECAKKLFNLADFLETKVPDERFDYSRWSDGSNRPSLTHCGTIGCAAGWLDEASGGACHAWLLSAYSDRWEFSSKAAITYLGMDDWRKQRLNDIYSHTDFTRLFTDFDNKLAPDGFLTRVPKAAVIARIRACAAAYEKMARRGGVK